MENIKLSDQEVQRIAENESVGVFRLDKAPDGVYMLTDNQKLIKPDFFGLHKENKTVHAIVVIDAGRKIAVDLEDSEEELCILEDNKSIGKEFNAKNEVVQDFDGEANTVALIKENSPAAKYCAERGKHLPSAGEMKLVNKYREMVGAALIMAEGKPFQYALYWTSSQYSDTFSWGLYWPTGKVDLTPKGAGRLVRAFTAL